MVIDLGVVEAFNNNVLNPAVHVIAVVFNEQQQLPAEGHVSLHGGTLVESRTLVSSVRQLPSVSFDSTHPAKAADQAALACAAFQCHGSSSVIRLAG